MYDGFEEIVQAWLACAWILTGAQGDVAHFERDSAGRRVDGDDGAGVGERDGALGALGALEFGLRSALRRSRVGLRSGLLLGLWGVRSSCALAAARDGVSDAGVGARLGAVLAVVLLGHGLLADGLVRPAGAIFGAAGWSGVRCG